MPNDLRQRVETLLENEPGYDKTTGQWEVIVKYNGDLTQIESDLGVKVEFLGDFYAILTLNSSDISKLYNYKEIEYIELPKNLTLSLRESMSSACITSVQSQTGFGLSGNGVVVGIIDSGIDYTHPDFRDKDGKSRILFLWDQLGQGNPPNGFLNGTEYDNNQINVALENSQPFNIIPPMDYVGHGTAVSGIAAGNGRASGGLEKGVAPEVSLIIVRLGEKGRQSFARSTEIMRAFKYIISKAELLNMPVAINLSYGTNNGSHSGNTLFETYIDSISQRWKSVIVVATGNEGYAGHHFEGYINSGETQIVEFAVQDNLNSLYLTLWKNLSDTLYFELIAPGGYSSGILKQSEAFRKFNMEGATVTVFYGQPSFYNGNQEVYIQISGQIPKGIWKLKVIGQKITQGEYHIWLPTIEEVGLETSFSLPSPALTLTLPSTAKNVISVGGYNSGLNSAVDFSGRGYTFQNIYVKPDLVAPAVNILTTQMNGGYGSFTGTSMAAPFVTGAAALMLEWGIVQKNDPFLYGQRVKAFLQYGANRNPGISYPNPIWGYGSLCLKNTMDNLISGS